jgi:RNA polymerase sigma factor (sigma-70 family)
LPQLRQLFTRTSAAEDAALLQRFHAQRDEGAFAELVRRHGPMVLGVCRRLLRNEHDAEDAFQAAFLVLARRAAALDRPERLGNWLHGVAVRVAREAPARAAARDVREASARVARPADPLAELRGRELRAVVDEEIARLPEAYRAAFVLCHLEGHTHAETARALGCPQGSVSWRLARACELLRKRLTQRGVVPSAGVLTALGGGQNVSAVVPAPLAATAVRAALAFLLGESAEEATGLARTALAPVGLTRAKASAVVLLAVSMAGIGLLASPGEVRQPPRAHAEKGAAAAPQAGPVRARTDLHGDPLPSGALARLGTVRFRPGEPIATVAISPDGKLLAAGDYRRTLALLDRATGKVVRRFQGERAFDCQLAFSPDGSLLASAGLTGQVSLWNVPTGKEVHRFSGRIGTLAVFSPDGSLLATAYSPHIKIGGRIPPPDPVIRLLDVATGKLHHDLRGHTDEVQAVAFSPDGKLLASVSSDKTARLWDVAGRRELRRLRGAPARFLSVAFAPDGARAAGGDQAGDIHVWDAATGKELRCFHAHRLGVFTLAFSSDGRRLASGGQEREPIRLWDPATGKEVRSLNNRGDGSVRAVAFSSDGRWLACGGNLVQVWDTATGRDASPYPGQGGAVWCLTCTPDGSAVALAGDDTAIGLWDRVTGRLLRRFEGHELRVVALACSPDGRRLFSVSRDRTLRVWELGTGKELGKFVLTPKGVDRVAFSADGRLLAFTEGTSVVRLWHTSTGRELRNFACGRMEIHGLSFSQDGKRLAVGGHGGKVRVWEVATGREQFRVPTPPNTTLALALSPDGRGVATAGWNDRVRVWEVGSGHERAALPLHGQACYAVAFSPDGSTVAWIDQGQAVRLWDLGRNVDLGRRAGHLGAVSALGFSPDGRFLISGSHDTTALVWEVRPRSARRAYLEK